jgi:hypothetical protein
MPLFVYIISISLIVLFLRRPIVSLRWQGHFVVPVRLTCCWPPDYAQLAGNVHHAASHAWPAVVGGQRVLCEHLLDSCSRGKPASSVVYGVDVVELFGSGVMRALVVAQHAWYTIISLAHSYV